MEEQENTEEIKSFEDLSKTEKNENDMMLPEKEVDDFGRSYATGKRKDAVARVWLKQGLGNITINGKSSDDYFEVCGKLRGVWWRYCHHTGPNGALRPILS